MHWEKRPHFKLRFIIFFFVVFLNGAGVFAATEKLKDVPEQQSAAVYRALRMGIMRAYPDGTFRGEQPISRYEMLYSLSKILEELERNPKDREIPATRNPYDQNSQRKLVEELRSEIDLLKMNARPREQYFYIEKMTNKKTETQLPTPWVLNGFFNFRYQNGLSGGVSPRLNLETKADFGNSGFWAEFESNYVDLANGGVVSSNALALKAWGIWPVANITKLTAEASVGPSDQNRNDYYLLGNTPRYRIFDRPGNSFKLGLDFTNFKIATQFEKRHQVALSSSRQSTEIKYQWDSKNNSFVVIRMDRIGEQVSSVNRQWLDLQWALTKEWRLNYLGALENSVGEGSQSYFYIGALFDNDRTLLKTAWASSSSRFGMQSGVLLARPAFHVHDYELIRGNEWSFYIRHRFSVIYGGLGYSIFTVPAQAQDGQWQMLELGWAWDEHTHLGLRTMRVAQKQAGQQLPDQNIFQADWMILF